MRWSFLPHLNGQAVLQVEEARLADVLELGARLAHLGLLVAHLGAGAPPEDGEGPRADLALLAVALPDHAQVGVVAQAGLAQQGELGVLPVLPVVRVSALGGRHGGEGGHEGGGGRPTDGDGDGDGPPPPSGVARCTAIFFSSLGLFFRRRIFLR